MHTLLLDESKLIGLRVLIRLDYVLRLRVQTQRHVPDPAR